MTDILMQPAPQTESEYEAAINEMLAEMRRLNEQMRRDDMDINRLKAEAEAYKVEAARYKQEIEHGQVETGTAHTNDDAALRARPAARRHEHLNTL